MNYGSALQITGLIVFAIACALLGRAGAVLGMAAVLVGLGLVLEVRT